MGWGLDGVKQMQQEQGCNDTSGPVGGATVLLGLGVEGRVQAQTQAQKCAHVAQEAGMMSLYPVNPYEAFILMCIVSDDPLDTFAAVWEKSYEESESSVQ